MAKYLDDFPDIIKEASRSSLGIIALSILTLAVLGIIFFKKSGEKIRLVIFFTIFIGIGLLATALIRAGNSSNSVTQESESHEAVGREPTGPTTSIILFYDVNDPTTGSFQNCGFILTKENILINSKVPVSLSGQNPVIIDKVPVGKVTYKLTTQIFCQNIGTCNATGSDTVTVSHNSRYKVKWRNTAQGICSIFLDPY